MGRHSRKNSKSVNEDVDDNKSDVSEGECKDKHQKRASESESEAETKAKKQKRASESNEYDEALEAKINRIVEKKTAVYKKEIDLLKANQYTCPWGGDCPCCLFWNKEKPKMNTCAVGFPSSSGGAFRGQGRGRGGWRGNHFGSWRGGYFS